MTNPIHYQNQSLPSYSGVTINISNPTVNAGQYPNICPPSCNTCYSAQINPSTQQSAPIDNKFSPYAQYPMTNPVGQNTYSQNFPPNLSQTPQYLSPQGELTTPTQSTIQTGVSEYANTPNSKMGETAKPESTPAYPPQYYLNNYNYIQNGEKGNFQAPIPAKNLNEQNFVAKEPIAQNYSIVPQEEDMSSSENIKNELDARLAEQKDLEKNGTKTKVVALTNEYIMSLENYLNNPNTEIRLMASKEILTRLDEDKDRHDDAALNALLNKMLQDPEKLIRIAALSAFSSQLASGNEFTFELLQNIQNDPNADKEDVVQAADCLLKMSSTKETKFTPAEKAYTMPQQTEAQVEK